MSKCPWVLCATTLPPFYQEVEICTVDRFIYTGYLEPKSYKWVSSLGSRIYRDQVTDWKHLTKTPLPERFL